MTLPAGNESVATLEPSSIPFQPSSLFPPMANDKIESTLATLRAAREKTDTVLVGYSGGKDSLVVTDLCVRTFSRVVGFYMYLVPGLRSIEALLNEGRQRFGIEILQYPHWTISRYIKEGMYCNSHRRHEGMPEWTLFDVFDLAMTDTGIPLVVTGAKESDSASRRRLLRWGGGKGQVVYPIQKWHKHDVLGYLKARGIPIPASTGLATTGLDLSTPEVLWLYDNYPDDFERLARVFPHVPAIVYRREWYGISTDQWGQ